MPRPTRPLTAATPRGALWACLSAVALAALLAPTAAPARAGDATGAEAAPADLPVQGDAPRPVTLSAADLAAMTRTAVTVPEKGGGEARYEGVLLGDVLARAGVPSGKGLKGEWLARVCVVEAADGYRAAFALPELDAAYGEGRVLLADRKDGKPLSPEEGPYKIVVPSEKLHARWVRRVTAVRVVKVP